MSPFVKNSTQPALCGWNHLVKIFYLRVVVYFSVNQGKTSPFPTVSHKTSPCSSSLETKLWLSDGCVFGKWHSDYWHCFNLGDEGWCLLPAVLSVTCPVLWDACSPACAPVKYPLLTYFIDDYTDRCSHLGQVTVYEQEAVLPVVGWIDVEMGLVSCSHSTRVKSGGPVFCLNIYYRCSWSILSCKVTSWRKNLALTYRCNLSLEICSYVVIISVLYQINHFCHFKH